MFKYILKRIFYIFVVFMILSFTIYMIYSLIPGDQAYSTAQAEVKTSKGALDFDERYEYWKGYYGTNGNLIQRYGRWLGVYPYQITSVGEGTVNQYRGLLQGKLGTSIQFGKPVLELMKEPMRNTIFINIFVIIFGLGITIPLGIFCARKKGSKRDTAIQVGTIIGYSVPSFITAILFIWLFSIVLGIFPVSGQITVDAGYEKGTWAYFWDEMYHFALPLIVMIFGSLGGMTRYVRASMVEALSMDCVRTARAKGLKESVVVHKHAWRNALIPIVTLVIGWFLGIFSGSLMIENIFGLNGIGRIYYQALTNRDYPVILALQMFYIFIGLVGNLIIDISYGIVDPRIRINK